MRARAGLVVTVAITLAGSSPALAQLRNRLVVQADSALGAGDIGLADSLYYTAVRYRPRDPETRAALGRYLGALGRTKVAIVLLEEARLFGGDPAQVARQLAPFYEYLGEWRALLTLPGSSFSASERKRIAWLAENPFAAAGDAGATSIVGAPRGDTIARVAVRIGDRAAVASIVGTDVGFVVGSRIAGTSARYFDRDSSVVAFDSVTVGQMKFVNVPATIGPAASTMSVGAAALGRMVLEIDYRRNRLALVRSDAGPVESRLFLLRMEGQLRVLDRGRWMTLGEYAAVAASASKTIVVDVAAGVVRVRP